MSHSTELHTIGFGRSTVAAYIDSAIDRYKDHEFGDWIIDHLALFDRTRVRATLRTMLGGVRDTKAHARLVELIGYFGDASDVEHLDRLLLSDAGVIANTAFEAKLRLTDPLRLAERW